MPNPLAIVERLRRPESRAPGFRHLTVLLPHEIVDAGRSSLPCIERTNPLSISLRNARSFSTWESNVRPICSWSSAGRRSTSAMACSRVLTMKPAYQIRRSRASVPLGGLTRPAMTKQGRLAFPLPADDIEAREVGGGRATRQPGQIRKEAALTSAVRVARQPPTFITVGRMSEATSGVRASGTQASGFRFAHPGYTDP